jgi:hypothetical protein
MAALTLRTDHLGEREDLTRKNLRPMGSVFLAIDRDDGGSMNADLVIGAP